MEKQNLDPSTNIAIQEIEHKLRQFQANFETGMDSGLTFSSLERNLEKLLDDTRKTYLDTVSDYLSSVDETEIIRQKKENTEKEG